MKQGTNKNIIAQKGQSLVEVAIFFPIFIILLAGMVEVANIIVTSNKVTSAARASTRFASNGGENAGMSQVALNTVTQTLEIGEDVWDIFAIRGTINAQGNDFEPGTWEFTHVYGISNTTRFDQIDEDAIKADVLAQLQKDENGKTNQAIASELRFVGTYAMHDIESILGLNALPQYSEISSVADLSVMRVVGVEAESTNGCDGFPIAVSEGIRSVSKSTYPQPGDFSNSNPPYTPPTYASFIHHVDDLPFPDATEGTVYKIQNGFGGGSFGWLQWNTGVNQSALEGSLAWPGNARDYTSVASGQTLPGQSHPVYGFIEAGDASDTQMHIGDWVAARPGSVNSNGVRDTLGEHIKRGRTLRVIVYKPGDTQGTGSNGAYKISGFAIMRLQGYRLNQGGGESWILAEFIRWDRSCGQQ